MAIHLESVAFSFQDRLIFNNLDLTLDKGHTYVVLGKSGVGKSTLLSLLKGVAAAAIRSYRLWR